MDAPIDRAAATLPPVFLQNPELGENGSGRTVKTVGDAACEQRGIKRYRLQVARWNKRELR
ncbi:MAG TPA: hypothetical protein VN664_08770 [Burkholderiales bacterium]|nr:hypothetical protein [Burkholderiales bacterium]